MGCFKEHQRSSAHGRSKVFLTNIFKLCIVLSDSSRKLSLPLFIPADGIPWHVAYKHRRLNKVFMTNSNLWILSNSLLKLPKLVGFYHMAVNYAKCERVSFLPMLHSTELDDLEFKYWERYSSQNISFYTDHCKLSSSLPWALYVFPNGKDPGRLIL